MTRDCLESIFRDTAYPNVEVIVVDNGSQDGSRNWLRWLARSRPELRVLLNAGNAGFAAANNQALRIATGEVLVLLNNDTVVPRSWLDPLLRALRDPGVGLVGPVTNSVGNEARIEIDYAAIEGMQEFVDRRRATHAGLSFDITMLAMFCVALRRDTLQRVGLLDEAFGIGLFEDDDYSRRVQQCGLRTLCVEDAYVHHHGQASFKKLIAGGEYQQLWDRNQAYFEGKWGRWTAHAPRSPAAPPAVTAASDAERELTAERWSTNVAGSDAFSPEVYWLAVPAVQARHQRRGCGGGDHPDWVHYCLDAFLRDRRPVARMLSLGCGSGGLERQLARLDAFVACDAFDLADGALAIARREAAAIGAHHIDYRQVDIEQSDLPRAHYGAVWFNGSLHHIRELERVLGNVARSLEPDGWLFFNEYVGARHFGFGAAQRAAIERAFQAIPPHYRRSFAAGSRGEIQHAVPLPDPVEVRRVDPSEAVRSDEILRVVAEYFDIVACNPCGGSILQFALHGIAGNFRADDVASMQVLEQLFRTEDALIADGTLGSDFVVVAARAKAGHGAR
jgi:GT2 family glycosyltransferase/2-polyprenyl-3-methyl-5-hydroxy-6-metoxy-1,4-benzoquinol methylase